MKQICWRSHLWPFRRGNALSGAQQRTTLRDLLRVGALSAVAGYVDAAGFLALSGLLAAHVTGDLVAAGTVVASQEKVGAAVKLLMVPVFMLAVAAATLCARAIRRRDMDPVIALLSLLTLALGMFCITGVELRNLAAGPDTWAAALTAATAVIAMGIQNALMRNALSSSSPTTIMTGNLTQFTIDLVEIILPERAARAAERAEARAQALGRLLKFGLPLIGFLLGALVGAWLTVVVGLLSIALPTVVVAWLTLEAWMSRPRSIGTSASALTLEPELASSPGASSR